MNIKDYSFRFTKVILIFGLFFLSSSLFAFNLRTGFYGTSQFPIGEASNYFKNAAGPGLAVEFGFIDNFGQSLRLQWESVIPKNDKIINAWQLSQLLGLWYSIPIGASGFAAQPSIEIGLMYQGAKIQDGYGTLPKRAYLDCVIQLCPSFRFKHPKMLSNCIELELSPLWSIIPQKSQGLVFAGARLGIFYVFDL